MGLFDKLLKEGKQALKDAAKEAAGEENKEKASAFLHSLKDSLQEKKNRLLDQQYRNT